MLVLSRKAGQRLIIDDRITITINRISGNRVQVGIEAPDDVHIMRGELDKIRREFSDLEDIENSNLASISFISNVDTSHKTTTHAVR